jgi:hypothetical protein
MKEQKKMKDETRRQEERKREIKHIQLLTLGLQQIPKFIYTTWMGPMVTVTYTGQTQKGLYWREWNLSSWDLPAKIAVDSNANCFMCFNSGVSSPEIAEFCPTLRLIYVIAWAEASTCALSRVYSLPCNKLVQNVNPQVEKLFATAF